MRRQFDQKSERRIARSVIKSEHQGRAFKKATPLMPFQFPASAEGPLMVQASADIEHESFGTAKLLKGSDFDSSLTADANNTYTVFNPRDKIWQGANMFVLPCRLANSKGNKLVCLQAWSATQIRATAPSGGITAGGSGTVTGVVPLNGHYSPTSVTAHLLTSSVDVGASEEVWAQLVYSTSSSTSRWEIYAADCT